jgi:hypothetical protein
MLANDNTIVVQVELCGMSYAGLKVVLDRKASVDG